LRLILGSIRRFLKEAQESFNESRFLFP